MSLLQLFVGDIYSLLNFMSFLRWLFIGMAVLGLIYLRFTQPDLPRPFKVRRLAAYRRTTVSVLEVCSLQSILH